MKPRELSLVAAVVAATLSAGCATTDTTATGATATAPAPSAKKTADAIVYISGLS